MATVWAAAVSWRWRATFASRAKPRLLVNRRSIWESFPAAAALSGCRAWLAKTMEIANRIAEKSPVALSLVKEAVKLASRSNLDEGLRREVDLFALCFSS